MATAGAGRNETAEERLDRKLGDLLQELRVMQTGAQLTAAFLLTIPFQDAFADLDRFQVGLYLVLVLLAVLTTALVLTPVAIHRRLSGQHVKEHVVAAAHRLAQVALVSISLLMAGILVLVFDVVVDRWWAVAAGTSAALVIGILMVGVPHRLSGWDDRS